MGPVKSSGIQEWLAGKRKIVREIHLERYISVLEYSCLGVDYPQLISLVAFVAMNLLRISEAASLGLHTMALLARDRKRRFTTQEIATQLGASEHHLAKVMQRLTRAGMVDAVRGPLGGFQLSKAPSKIKLLDVFEAIEGPLGQPTCLLSRPACEGRGHCALGDMVHQVHNLVRDYLAKTTLNELALGALFLKTN